jgi:hypothetical protein
VYANLYRMTYEHAADGTGQGDGRRGVAAPMPGAAGS